MRHGDFDEAELEEQLNARGFMNRFYGRATRAVKKPWQMYPLGLPVRPRLRHRHRDRAARRSPAARPASGLPFYAILCLPILFAAGMSLLDTIDGAFMNFAYGWAFSQAGAQDLLQHHRSPGCRSPSRCVIGTIELLSVLADKLSLTGGIWDFVSNLDLNLVGYAIVGLFVLTWVVALGGLALRAHRGALDARGSQRAAECADDRRAARSAAALRATSTRSLAALRAAGGRLSRRAAARARGAVRRRRAGVGRRTSPAARRPQRGARPRLGLPQPRAPRGSSAWSATSTSATAPGSTRSSARGEREYLVCERCDRVTTRRPGAARRRARRSSASDFGYQRALHPLPDQRPVRALCRAGGRGPHQGAQSETRRRHEL